MQQLQGHIPSEMQAGCTQGLPAMKKKMTHRVYTIRHVHQGKWLPLFLSTARSANCCQVLTTTPCRFKPLCNSAGSILSSCYCSIVFCSMLGSTVSSAHVSPTFVLAPVQAMHHNHLSAPGASSPTQLPTTASITTLLDPGGSADQHVRAAAVDNWQHRVQASLASSPQETPPQVALVRAMHLPFGLLHARADRTC